MSCFFHFFFSSILAEWFVFNVPVMITDRLILTCSRGLLFHISSSFMNLKT